MRFLLPICLIMCIVLTAIYVNSQDSGGHATFSIKCVNCHVVEPKDGDNTKNMIFSKDVSLLCMDCHSMVKKTSHPVGLKASMDVPKDFPLDWQGKNTCITCHAVHNGGYGKYILRSERTGKAFCIECHGKNLESGIGMHKGMGSAHFGSRYTVFDEGIAIDELSIQCLSCHDGQLAGDVSIKALGSGTFEHSDRIGVSHPIGIDYIKLASMPNNDRLVKPEFLPSEIKLFAGKVGCGSCHNPFSDRHKQTVMSNSRSALCAACHIK